MRIGEGYKFDFWDWFEALPENEQQQYKEIFPPPIVWGRSWYNLGEDKNDEAYSGCTEQYMIVSKAQVFGDKLGEHFNFCSG